MIIADLDKYMKDLKCHIQCNYAVDKQLLDMGRGNFQGHVKEHISHALAEQILNLKMDHAIVTEDCYMKVEYKVDLWVFTKAELQLYIREAVEDIVNG